MISIVTVFILILALLLFAISKCYDVKGKCKELAEKIKNILFFNSMFRYAFLNCLNFMMTGMIAMTMFSETSRLKKIIAVIIFAAITLSPVLFSYILYKKRDLLDEEATKVRYNALYDGKNVKNKKWVFLYPLTYFSRRLIFSAATIFLIDHPS